MAASTEPLSDRALSIVTFAAYHHLIGGQPIRAVVRRDDAGHRADPDGVREVEARGLATTSEDEITFTPEGVAVVETVVAAIRQAAGG
ncbi:MAG: hypothetical protein K2X71_09530 [Methylobacterium sp.]|uniref:hypothetical protein n=1 Tax=Methylobacterium sp. TaxID=409 RepID=UPI00258EBB05|nr:hypothetical protein [Methylobacterium sp.]MBY0296262.1 hypothetical protein [Methylobacterium sp.]